MAMAENEKGDTASTEEGEAWGTLEELLLACAICRHGTESWDSISLEVQKRAHPGNRNKDDENFKNNFSNAFTPQACEHKYHALKRRFNVTRGGDRNDSTAVEEDTWGGRELREKLSFMVNELRKLRVEELRRQVERHDVSIVSLQLKVKKLEDAREKSSSKAEPEVGGVDLGKRADRGDADERRVRGSAELADKSDEPDDGSFNESNSTSHKEGPSRGRELNQSREPDPVLPVADSAPDKDCSSSRGGDGGYDLEKDKVVGRASPPNRLGNSGSLRESVSESKREGKESKQSSDVQSSASLSRRKRRGCRRGDGIGSSGDEMETEEWSPANKRKGVKSQPLIKFFEIVRSHKHGLVFQRRLPSQETEKYRNLIRQHMDLETVQSKLERDVYSDCHLKFYRDVLLIFSNAILFFCKSSTENAAARELRKLVMKEIVSQRKPKPALTVKPNLESQILDPVVKKPRSSTNIVVCRRRTNSSAKSKELEEVKVESLDTKPSVNMKDSNGKNDESSDEEEQPINKRRKKLVRKQGVVNFLKRMQQNSPSKEAMMKPNDDTEEELQEEWTKKAEIGKKKVVAGKKKDGDDGAAKRRVLGRRSTKGEEVENLETLKRGSGRPPARKAAMGGSGGGTPDNGRLKRRRDGEKEAADCPGKNTTAKKSRR